MDTEISEINVDISEMSDQAVQALMQCLVFGFRLILPTVCAIL